MREKPSGNIFRSKELNRKFILDGFVKIPFLNPDEINRLQEFHDLRTPDLGKDFYLSLWTSDLVSRRQTHEFIEPFFVSKAAKLLEGYSCMISAFAVKKPSINSAWVVHQDDSFVNEETFTSLSIWCPLMDVDQQNGALQVWRGSHRIFTRARGSNIPNIFDEVSDLIRSEFMETIEMKAGEAIVFDHRLVHASPPNRSSQNRVAAVAVMIPEEADIRLYHRERDSTDKQLEVLKLQKDYYINFSLVDQPGKRPTGEGVESLGFVPDQTMIQTPEMIHALRKPEKVPRRVLAFLKKHLS